MKNFRARQIIKKKKLSRLTRVRLVPLGMNAASALPMEIDVNSKKVTCLFYHYFIVLIYLFYYIFYVQGKRKE